MTRTNQRQRDFLAEVSKGITSNTNQISLKDKNFTLVNLKGTNYLIDLSSLTCSVNSNDDYYIKFHTLTELKLSNVLQEYLEVVYYACIRYEDDEDKGKETYKSLIEYVVDACISDDELRHFQLSLFKPDIISIDTIELIIKNLGIRTGVRGLIMSKDELPEIIKEHAICVGDVSEYKEVRSFSFSLSEGWKIYLNGEEKENHYDYRSMMGSNLIFTA